MSGGILISVVDGRHLNGPARVLASGPDFREVAVPGSAVVSSGGNIFFESGFDIDIRHARRWIPIVKRICSALLDISVISKALEGYSFVKPRYVENFRDAVLLCDRSALESSIRELTGLGPGLTPSGDDFLAGFISAGHFFRGRRQFDFFLENAKINPGATNLISAYYLEYALEGRVSETISNIVLSTAARDRALGSWLRVLLGAGATSGADTLYGVLTAMEVFNACESC